MIEENKWEKRGRKKRNLIRKGKEKKNINWPGLRLHDFFPSCHKWFRLPIFEQDIANQHSERVPNWLLGHFVPRLTSQRQVRDLEVHGPKCTIPTINKLISPCSREARELTSLSSSGLYDPRIRIKRGQSVIQICHLLRKTHASRRVDSFWKKCLLSDYSWLRKGVNNNKTW